jgi:hypothetical protein
MPDIKIVVLGFVAGIIPDVLRMVKLATVGAPAYVKSWFFWSSLVVLGLLGAFACWLVNPTGVLEAFAVGYSAPEILSRLGGKIPPGLSDRGDGAGRPKIDTLLGWWGV